MEKKKVLVVDDEENIRRLMHSMLGNKYTILEANDGEVAIDIARNQRPDIILMDILMPNIDGYTACYTIKKDPVTKAIPVVMLTALGQELNMKLAEKIGADGYITKPFTRQDLLDTITRFLKSPK